MGGKEADILDDEKFAAHCEWAASVVETWPEWRRNCLSWWQSESIAEAGVASKPHESPAVVRPHAEHFRENGHGPELHRLSGPQ